MVLIAALLIVLALAGLSVTIALSARHIGRVIREEAEFMVDDALGPMNEAVRQFVPTFDHYWSQWRQGR